MLPVIETFESLTTIKAKFTEYVDRVEHEDERVVITRRGRPSAIILSMNDYEGLLETIDIMSDPALMKDIAAAEAEVARGEVVEGVDAVRAILKRRRSSAA